MDHSHAPGTPKPLGSRNPYRRESLATSTSSTSPPYVLPALQEQATGTSSTYTAKTRTTVSPAVNAHEAEHTAEDGWATCLRVMADHDRSLLKAWNAEIDGLLLLAGLLSGVVTTFAVQSSTMLSPDPTTTSTALLAQISLQIATSNPSTTLPITGLAGLAAPTSFSPTRGAVCVNALWFLSLTLSLLTAVAGLLLRQWLAPRTRGGGAGTSVRARVRARERTRAAFARWRVPAVVGALPTLLQLSVALFLAGLVLLLWELHPVVAGVVSVPVAAAALAMSLTVVLPALAVDCPYRSPASERLARGVKVVTAYIHGLRRRSTTIGLPLVSPRTPSFALTEKDEPAVADAALDKAALAWTQGAVSDPTLGVALLPCLADLDREGVLTWAAQERGLSVPRLLQRIRRDTWAFSTVPPSEPQVLAILAAIGDGSDDTARWGVARMDVIGLLAHVLEETRVPSERLLRRVLADLLPVLDVAEVRSHHASRLSEFLYRTVSILADEHAYIFTPRDRELLLHWALRCARTVGPSAPAHEQRAFEGAATAALHAGASTPRLLDACVAFFAHTTLPALRAPWFALLPSGGEARAALVALCRGRHWAGAEDHVYGDEGEVGDDDDGAAVWLPDGPFEVREVRTGNATVHEYHHI